MSNDNELSLGVWGLVAVCCVTSVGCAIAFCVNQFNATKPIQAINLISDTELDISQKKTKAISEYATLVENSNADLSIINEAFERYHLEANAFVNTGKHQYHSNKNTRQSITMVSYFQVTEEQKVMLREQQCNTELLRACQELMQEYPQNSFLKSTTLEEVESACTLYEEHHAKVLNIAEVILPSLHGMLNEAKRMNASISRVNCV